MINRIAFISLLVFSLAATACGDDGGDTSPDAATTPDTDAAPPDTTLSCANYCATIDTNCPDPDKQYVDEAECTAKCAAAAWTEGTIDAADADKNTLGCRVYHATAAADDAATHCPHASLHGGGTCGSDCVNYCSQFLTACAGDAANTYADQAACELTCAAFGTDGIYGDTTGDTVQCRLYHAGLALTTDPAIHCGHAAETPTAGGCVAL